MRRMARNLLVGKKIVPRIQIQFHHGQINFAIHVQCLQHIHMIEYYHRGRRGDGIGTTEQSVNFASPTWWDGANDVAAKTLRNGT